MIRTDCKKKKPTRNKQNIRGLPYMATLFISLLLALVTNVNG